MPDATITAPVAADSVDRLALGASDARLMALSAGEMDHYVTSCMAEE